MGKKVIIIDFGSGNLNSVKRKLDQLKTESFISSNTSDILHASKLILPGVGHFQKAMENLRQYDLIQALSEAVLVKKIPVLGICLGMQLMAQSSEEGNVEGLGWFKAKVVKFKVTDTLKYKIPHMGWNEINICKSSMLMNNISDGSEFYFVHSYHIVCEEQADILNQTEYDYRFCSAIEKENIFGVQYHPEKSHEQGEKLLKNFIQL